MPSTDDFLFLWVGSLAVVGWNAQNSLINSNLNVPALSTQFSASQGQYVPFRIQYGQVNYDFSLDVELTAPDGTLMMSGTADSSNYLVQHSCDGITAPVFPDSCDNIGVEWAWYANPSPYADQTDVTYFKRATPAVSGVTTAGVYFDYDCQGYGDVMDIYGTSETCQNFILSYRGYIFADQIGIYTITIPANADDRAWVWTGSIAYAGWNNNNEKVEASFGGYATTASNTASYAVTRAGQYIPYRVILAQDTGPMVLSIQITAPDGTVLMSPDGSVSNSNNLVRFSCDGSTPAFQAFGSEA